MKILKRLIRFVFETSKKLTRFCIEHFGNIFQAFTLMFFWSLLALQVGVVYATIYLFGGILAFMVGTLVLFIVGIFSLLFVAKVLSFGYQTIRAWAYEQEMPVWKPGIS